MKRDLAFKRLSIFLVLLLAITTLFALSVGRYSMNPIAALSTLWVKLNGRIPEDQSMETILFVIRIPRILAAILIGASLSVSGAVYQSVFKNPLVSPDLLGVSSGATVGAAAAILLGFSMSGRQLCAFAGGITAVLLALAIPKILRNSSSMMLVLAGIIVGGFMSSLLGIMKFVAEEQTELSAIVFWQMGSLSSIKSSDLLSISYVLIFCMIIMLLLSWRINILSFGDDEAKSLGINVRLLRGVTIVAASLLTACSVCISGTIGWIGLVVPHFGRILIGSDNTKLLPVTILVGGLFLLIIDTVARAMTTVEIPLSILTGLIGAPFYAWLLWHQKAKIQ